jgi:hypothetical protein
VTPVRVPCPQNILGKRESSDASHLADLRIVALCRLRDTDPESSLGD